MPPTAKPTSVIVHRIELQKTERELLEGYVAANGIGSILSGVGNLLNPFSAVIAAIFAAWIAEEGIKDVWAWIDGKLKEKDRRLTSDYLAYLEAYEAAVATGGSPDSGPPMTEREFKKKFEKDYETNWDQFITWLSPSSMEGRSDSTAGRRPGTGSEGGGFTPPGR
jgi:hypothetical protein